MTYTYDLGTYGGHLELSAFAHLKRRNVKVIQPGLVYVIEWMGGGEPSSPKVSHSPGPPVAVEDPSLSERERRKLRREKRKEQREKSSKAMISSDDESDDESDFDTVYVAYVVFTHFYVSMLN